MTDKDKGEISKFNYKIMKRILKSALYTLFIILSAIFIIGFIFGLLFHGGDTSIIIILCISIIFTIFYCTMTIIEELRNIE